MPTIVRLKKKQIYNNNKNLAQQYVYRTTRWIKLRLYKLSCNPLCERCLEIERVEPAVQVHHMTPFMQGVTIEQIMYLGFDFNNLQSICQECHKKIHK